MQALDQSKILKDTVNDVQILSKLSSALHLCRSDVQRITDSYKQYKSLSGANTLTPLGLTSAQAEQFHSLYKSRTKKTGLNWIKNIHKTSEYTYCPMCGSETHNTLEHFLPRNPWAELSFFSLNLLPSCSTCNSKRRHLANAPNTTPRLLHPYFDQDLLSKQIHVTEIISPFAAPKFLPSASDNLPDEERKRVSNHLSKCIDLMVYRQFCSNRWAEVKREAYRMQDLEDFRKNIANHVDDSVAISGLNSWKTAFYAGLLKTKDAIDWLFEHRIEI